MSNLGRLLVLTDRRQARRPLPSVVAEAVAGGARTVILREKDLPPGARRALADELHRILAPAGGTLIVAGGTLIVAGGPGACVHLAAADPMPADRPALVGRSCHDPSSVDAATAEGVDYLTVSPVYPSTSKPGYGPPLGPDGLARLAGRTDVPVFALGGLESPAAVAACLAAGAAGVAVMGAVMRADDPAAVVGKLLAEVTS